MTGYVKTLTLTLAALSANAISTTQTPGGAGNLTITGSLASGGVATFLVPQRVGITSTGDISNRTFTITGTGNNGASQSEALTGPNNATVHTLKDFATVTQIAISGAAAAAVTAGSVGIGSTAPYIVDRFVNPNNHAAALVVSGTVNCTVEVSYDDLSPNWDINNNTTTWFGVNGWTGLTANSNGPIPGPFTMMRLTNNSGTGTSTLNVITPFIGGAF